MISVQEAIAILGDNLPQPKAVKVQLEKALGYFLSEDIPAPEASPRYTNSAMDGFAVRYGDCRAVVEGKQESVQLRIIGESQAGVPFAGKVTAGTAIRISTGAMVPDGADTVVRVEDTEEVAGFVSILAVRAMGQDVRAAGEEFQQGDLLLAKGVRVQAREMALLAAVGLHTVSIFRPPKVAVLVTGTELAHYGDGEIKPHQIRDSNSVMLTSAVRECSGDLEGVHHVVDNYEETVQAIRDAIAAGVDVVLCSGGVSVGRHDHVKDAALEAGFTQLFWKIKQKPGKPLFAARRGDVLLFGLPGNPVSAYMCFTNYVQPVLVGLLGTSFPRHSLTAKARQRFVNNGKRTLFVRVTVRKQPNTVAELTEVQQQGSHMLTSIVRADGYIVLQPGEVLEAGNLVEVILFK